VLGAHVGEGRGGGEGWRDERGAVVSGGSPKRLRAAASAVSGGLGPRITAPIAWMREETVWSDKHAERMERLDL